MSTPLQLFDALPAHIEDALRASIQRFGVLVPVVKDQHDRIIDGHHRSRIADELGVEYRVDVRQVADDDEAREIARTLNSDRRHLTEDQRREVVAELRQQGHSYRAIGGALGISHEQARKDAAAATVNGLTVQPDRVRGLDGKERRASRPTPADEPTPAAEEPPALPLDAADPALLVDCEKCGGIVNADDAREGYRRCQFCDPAGDHVGQPGQSCRACHPGLVFDLAPELLRPDDRDRQDIGQPDQPGDSCWPGGAGTADDEPPAAPEPWTDEETALRERLAVGETVVVSLRAHHAHLVRWADEQGLLVRIDRRTEWGNPFEMPADGDRKTVIRNYAEHYLPHKPSLLDRIETLSGKALACWCAPDDCHGDVLKEATEQ